MTAPEPDRITEADIDHGYPCWDELLEYDVDYWQEIRECCNGRNFWCDHYRQYPPPIQRSEP